MLDPLAGEEETRTVYIRDVGLIVAGAGLTTRANAIETSTRRKRRNDRMDTKLEPLVRFGTLELFSERAWQEVKEKDETKNKHLIQQSIQRLQYAETWQLPSSNTPS